MADPIRYTSRGDFDSAEANRLHADAFQTRVFTDDEWDWKAQVHGHSRGWVTARDGESLVGFVNVISDGFVHAWIQDVMVDPARQRTGTGRELVQAARDGAITAGCEWLHVDFDDEHTTCYIDACGFTPSRAGLIDLTGE